ncbi:hypothetical protein QR680_005417 [Steinernema hermaphroditum]|uniref:Cytoplasmic dynein 2 light intermediate chain 1 n=1 Tax=Steinernema hermaphroditum TaxID=289476 RepID=A0AA39HU68_9BILA|nr:hypothetical protein QR680_005417 [Steinernema hermaphroditum]
MLDIWSLAKERLQSAKQRSSDAEPDFRSREGGQSHEAHIVICGNRSCGKTTLIQRLLEVNENPRPTVALEYTFGRSTRNNVKELGHFWELGGGALLSNLLNVPLSVKNIETTSLLIILDLSKPEHLWGAMEALLKAAIRRVDEVLRETNRSNPTLHDLLLQRAAQRIGSHRDIESMRVFPIPLALVGSKYDEFQNLDTDSRRSMTRALRFVAHYHGASLHFYSNRMENLVSRGKAILGHFAFAKSFPKGFSTDFSKPLAVPAGSDSFEDIGLPVDSINHSAIRSSNAYELWKDNFNEKFPQDKQLEDVEDDPSSDAKFNEPEIDKFLDEKMRDLEMYVKQKKDREQLQAKTGAEDGAVERRSVPQQRPFEFD